MDMALSQAATDTTPLSERLLVAIIGPLISVVLGTGAIGFLLWRISRRAEDKRAEAEAARAEADRRLERERARNELENQLRHELLTPLLTAAAELYLATQHYWRVREDPERSEQEKNQERKALDAAYLKSRTAGLVFEARLEALFETDQPAAIWHKIDDLLTVRYMQLIGKDTDALYEKNSKGYEGKDHSGLTVKELRIRSRLLAEYHAAAKSLLPAVLSTPFRRNEQNA